MKEMCSWPGCTNQYPYQLILCGACHTLVIGDETIVGEKEDLPLSGESYRYTIISPTDVKNIDLLALDATAIVIFSTDEAMRKRIEDIHPKKTLVIDNETERKEGLNRLSKFLLTPWGNRKEVDIRNI